MRYFRHILFIGIVVLQIGILSSCSKDFHFKGKYPPIKTIAITEHGQNLYLNAVSGHVIVFFEPTVTHSEAIQYIQSLNGKVISQIVNIRYYLVDVGSGNESNFINQLKNHNSIKFAFLNAVEYPRAVTPQTFVMDNFYISHGNNVTYTLQECGLKTKINKYNVGLKDDETGAISSSEINSDLIRILNNAPKNTPIIINMSFGPAFVDPNIRYWSDENITAIVKNSYVKHYKESLKELVTLASFFKDKDFVIVKAAGNEGLKYLDEEILIDLARELSNTDYQILNEHFILVGAEDSRNSDYSNTVFSGNYNFLYTSVDISDLKINDKNLCGTSYAAPRVSCFISTTVNEHSIKATDALKAVKQITYRNPTQALTQISLEQEAKKIANENKLISDNKTISKEKSENNSIINNAINENGNLQPKSNTSQDFLWEKRGFGGGVVILGYNGFGGKVIIPEKINGLEVKSINYEAFKDKQINSVIIPNSVIYIGDSAFENNRLTELTIPNSVTDIGARAFFGNNLTSLYIPDSVTDIGSLAFSSNKLKSVTFGSTPLSIGYMAFAFNQLVNITIPNSILLGDDIYYGNQVTSVTINNMTWFGEKVIDPDFYNTYCYDNSKAAGTYTRPNHKSKNWTRK